MRRSRKKPLLFGAFCLVVGVLIGLVMGFLPAHTEGSGVALSVGPTQRVDGVAVGFTRNQQGAVAAATSYTTELAGRKVYVPSQRAKLFAHILSVSSRSQLSEEISAGSDAALVSSSKDGKPQSLAAFSSMAGYLVHSYSGSQAVIETLNAGYFQLGSSKAGVALGSIILTLVWEDGDWKIQALDAGRSSFTASQLKEFSGYRYVAS